MGLLRLQRAWALALVCVASLAAAPPAAGQNAQGELVKVGVLRDWPPQYSLNERGAPTGFAVEVMQEVAARAGLKVRTVPFDTFAQMDEALASGSIDVIPNLGIIEGRKVTADFTPPVETINIVLFVRAKTSDIGSVGDLAGKKVAAVQTNVGITLLRARGIEPVVYTTNSAALFDLLAGQVDALVYPSSVLWVRAREVGVADHLRQVGPPLAEIKRAIAVRKGNRALLDRLSAAVEDFVGTPDYQRIYVRWYGEEPPFWTVGKIGIAAGGVLALLLLTSLLWRYRTLSRHNRELREHIAQRDRAQFELAASEAKYRQLIETSTEGVWVIDAANVTTFVNARMAEMLGLTPAGMLGRPMTDFFDASLTGEAERNLQRRREGRAEVHDFVLRRVDGREVTVLMAASPITEAGQYKGALAMVSDITDRRRLEAELRQSQRLEALGRLTGGIAHDFNNLLVVISAAVDLAKYTLAHGGSVEGDLDDIASATTRAAALTSQLLAFARRRLMSPRVLRPAETIAAAAPLLRHLLGQNIELSLELAAPSGAVKIDPTQLEQLVFNLASNARDAMPQGGRFVISVGDQALPDSGERPAGEYVVISAADDGTGIPPDVLPHIFDPFFTTKAEGQGTGLGLATCHGIAAQAGGSISVTSPPGEGTRFTVFLPRVAAEAQPAHAPQPAAAPPETGLCVLVVEDEPVVRRMVRRILNARGYVVHEAGTPDEGLRLCKQLAPRVDVLLTDFRMPGMNGQELALACREVIAGLRVVYMSGDIGLVANLVALREDDVFLAKPFSSDDLQRALDSAAGGQPAATPAFSRA